MKTNNRLRYGFIAGLMLMAVLSRLLPHPANFTPIISVALFGGAYLYNRKIAYLLPLSAMVLSDILLSLINGYNFFTPMRAVVYSCLMLITSLGFLLRNKIKSLSVTIASLGGAFLFYLVTNFAVWAGEHANLYPKTAAGLVSCYAAALPYLGNMIAGNLFYSLILFGSFELAKHRFQSIKV